VELREKAIENKIVEKILQRIALISKEKERFWDDDLQI